MDDHPVATNTIQMNYSSLQLRNMLNTLHSRPNLLSEGSFSNSVILALSNLISL